MKKLIASLLTLALILTLAATAALAETPAPWTFINGIEFGMNMNQVMEKSALPNAEIDDMEMRGPVRFSELEYEHVADALGMNADIKYLFVDNILVAFHFDCADFTVYENVKALLTPVFGETVPFDAAKIGNGRFAVDDDGELYDCREMIEAEGLIIVLEQDHDGDVDVTFLDPTAAYLNP